MDNFTLAQVKEIEARVELLQAQARKTEAETKLIESQLKGSK